VEAPAGTAARSVRVLDLDPDLAVALAPDEFERARTTLVARAYEAAQGPWKIRQPATDPGALGLLVMDGAFGLHTAVGSRTTLELLGRGDVLQPWVTLGPETSVPPTVSWEVVATARVVLLDAAFARAAAEWPEVIATLMRRQVARCRRLCYQLAVNTSPRVDERIVFALWALADRWGHVTEAGTTFRLRLTHRHIAELVCAQRPSVSAALTRLRDEGRVSYSRDTFVLHGEVPGEVRALRTDVGIDPD